MYGLFGWLFSLVGTVFEFLVKHPFVQKMMIFTLFMGLITAVLTFLFDMVRPYMVANSIFVLASYLGVLQALTLYITILLAGFGVKQVLAFVRST